MVDDQGRTPDATAPLTPVPPVAAAGADATRAIPSIAAVGADATRAMPPVEDGSERWAARASVPPAGAVPVVQYDGLDEEYPAEPVTGPARSWLMPLVYGTVGLLLLGVLLAGLWLIAAADDEPGPTASPSVPAVPTPSAPSSAVPSRLPPSTSAPAGPTTAEPAATAVPPLRGLSEEEARQRLTDAGLRVQVTRRADPSATPGTVVDVQPDEGSPVAPNSVVRVVVAVAAASPSTTRSSSA